MSHTKPYRILHVIGAMDRGGAETLVMNLYRRIDRSHLQFDFLVNEQRECDYDEEIRELGGNIFYIPRFKAYNCLSYKRACDTFFKTHPEHPIVHGHIGFPAAIYLAAAKRNGRFTIAHSHAQNFPLSPAELAFRCISYPTRYIADYFIGCSDEAGADRYGKNIVTSDHYMTLKNGIDLNRYRFAPETRDRVRAELGIDKDQPVFGHIGRLTPVKNHEFLFDVFANVLKKIPNAVLLLAGRGELNVKLHEKAERMGLGKSVRFLGVRSDIPDVLMALDVFVFPSIKEGLPVATIEAQAAGLPCILSTGIPNMAAIAPRCFQLDLDDGVEAWANCCLDLYRETEKNSSICRSEALNAVRESGFDIAQSANKLSELYEQHLHFN